MGNSITTMDVKVVEASPYYFDSIHDMLSEFERVDRDQVNLSLLKMDVYFLETFSFWLKTLGYTTSTTDDDDEEESMAYLRSIGTALKLIWPKELKALSLRNRLRVARETSLADDDMLKQDCKSAIFELEANIEQTKRQVEGWTQFLMCSSIQYKSSTYPVLRDILEHLRTCLKDFSKNKYAEIVPLKKQIDILEAKILFLEESGYGVDCIAYGDPKKLPFLNFVGYFANSAACLTCLYWVKESNEEIATEMINLLFDMMHKFIPCVFDITPSYIDLLKSIALHPCDSILLREAVEDSVDFFFDHLTIILKDDFLILRDRLIFLFTFLLTDPPIEEEIRNQIYALLREEDAYLLLPFDEMKKDFSDKKMLLNDCMIKIDITVAKVRQLYYGSSNSCLKLEVEKMEYVYFVSIHRELYWIVKHRAGWADPVIIDQLRLYGMELRVLRVFLLCFAKWDDSDKEIKMRLRSLISSFQEIWEKEEEKGAIRLAHRLRAHRLRAIRLALFNHLPFRPFSSELQESLHLLASELEEKIQLSKLEIKARWVNLVHWSPLTSYEILKFMDSIIECLNDLVTYKASEIVSFKKQIETLEEKLVFLKNFLKLATICICSKELEEFKLLVQVFSNDAICLTFLYWANEKSASETNNMLSHVNNINSKSTVIVHLDVLCDKIHLQPIFLSNLVEIS